MPKKDEGMISKQNIEPHEGVTKDADQLLHDPDHSSAIPLHDTQEELGDEWRFTLRSPNGFKPQIVCDEKTALLIGKALQGFEWKIIERRSEKFEQVIEEATRELVEHESSWTILRFLLPSGERAIFRTNIGEKELTSLLQQKGWTREE